MFNHLYPLIRAEADVVLAAQPSLLVACQNYKFEEETFIAHCRTSLSLIPVDMAVDEWMDTQDFIIGDPSTSNYISLSHIYRSLEARGEKLKSYKIIAPLEILRTTL